MSETTTWYKTSRYAGITEVQVSSETDQTVIIDGRRSTKRSSYNSYFRAREEAVDYLLTYWEDFLMRANSEVRRANKAIRELKGE